MATIYHNPRCSKSRQTLELIKNQGTEPEVVLYLESTLKASAITELLSKLGISARQLLRKGEQAYKEQNLADASLTEKQLIEAMVNTPKLIERPIVVVADKAIIGRPPELVLEIL
jgi:arsenate reductase